MSLCTFGRVFVIILKVLLIMHEALGGGVEFCDVERCVTDALIVKRFSDPLLNYQHLVVNN